MKYLFRHYPIWIVSCHSGAWWRVRARPPCACGLPLRGGAGQQVGEGRAAASRSLKRPGCGSGRVWRTGARSRRAGSGRATQRRAMSAARAEGSAGRAVAGRRRCRLPGRGVSGLGCAGLPEPGRRRRTGRGRRRRREAGPTGRAGEAVSASPGRSGGETSSSCPGSLVYFSLFLSRSLSHFLAGNSH